MVSLTCDTATVGAATLVTLSLSSPEPTRVRVQNCLDGPVWPPRTQGVPAAGWDDDGYTGVVDGHLALGYACPADPTDRPARIVDERPPTDDETHTARSLVRELGDASPPRDAVDPTAETATDDTDTRSLPPAVSDWLDEVTNRLERAERLAGATSATEATAAVDAAGGPDEIRALRVQLAADEQLLTAVADQCTALAEDVEAAEIPVETLSRLA